MLSLNNTSLNGCILELHRLFDRRDSAVNIFAGGAEVGD